VRRSVLAMLYYASGDAPAASRFTGFFEPQAGMLGSLADAGEAARLADRR
jgi:hypothetical protein